MQIHNCDVDFIRAMQTEHNDALILHREKVFFSIYKYIDCFALTRMRTVINGSDTNYITAFGVKQSRESNKIISIAEMDILESPFLYVIQTSDTVQYCVSVWFSDITNGQLRDLVI